MDPMTIDSRRAGRRSLDVKREMLETSIKELPNYLVTVLDDEKGLYSFYYNHHTEADEMVKSLEKEGIPRNLICMYQRAS